MNFSIARNYIFCRENGDKIDNLIHSRSKMVIFEPKLSLRFKI